MRRSSRSQEAMRAAETVNFVLSMTASGNGSNYHEIGKAVNGEVPADILPAMPDSVLDSVPDSGIGENMLLGFMDFSEGQSVFMEIPQD